MKKTIYFIILLSGIIALSAFTGKDSNVDSSNPLASGGTCTNNAGMQEKLACESCHGGTAAQNGPVILVYEGGKMSSVGSVVIPGEHQIIVYAPEHSIQDLSTRFEEQIEISRKSVFSHPMKVVSVSSTSPGAAHQGFGEYIKAHSISLTINNQSEEAISLSNVLEGQEIASLETDMVSSNSLNVSFSLGVSSAVNVVLYNSNGQLLYSHTFPEMQAGDNQLYIPFGALNAHGIGVLQISGAGSYITKKVVLSPL